MKFATALPAWVIFIFSFLCLFQVTTWLEDIKEYLASNQYNFTWCGQRFTCLPNRSFIIDESLTLYGIQLNYYHQLN